MTMDEVLTKENVKEAMDHLLRKKGTVCADGMRIDDLGNE